MTTSQNEFEAPAPHAAGAGGGDTISRALLAAAVVAAASYLGRDVFDFPINFVAAWKASGIVLLAAFAASHRCWALTAALLASAFGDVALALEPARIVAGIGAFAVAHVLYAAIFAERILKTGVSRRGVPAALVLIVFGAAMLAWQRPDMGELRAAASAYNVIILAMAVLAALTRGHPLILIGAVLFVASDSLIALRWFKDMLAWAGPLVWVTYATAQICLTLGITADRRRTL